MKRPWLALALAGFLVGCVETESTFIVADEPPPDLPFAESDDFTHVVHTGRFANYTGADTWYPSWAADGRLYSIYADGCGPGGCVFFLLRNTGWSIIKGDDPLRLRLSGGTIRQYPAPYLGLYPSASLILDGVWYYGSYVLDLGDLQTCNNWCQQGPFVGFHISTDDGATWTPPPHSPGQPLFGESGKDGGTVRLGALHFVDFGQEMVHSPDGFAYLIGHGTETPGNPNNWIQGDSIYLVRVRPSIENINDPSAYEFYAGPTGPGGTPAFTSDLDAMRPLLTWPPGRLGSVSVTYDAPLDRYLLFTSRPHFAIDGTAPFDTMIFEAREITGPWRLVHYLSQFGTQAYFVNAPSKFISSDGKTLWLFYSANYSCRGPGCKEWPPGSQYSLSAHEIRIETGPAPNRREAENASLRGGTVFADSRPGYTGPGYASLRAAPPSSNESEPGVVFPIRAPRAGRYQLQIRHGGPVGALRLGLSSSAERSMALLPPAEGDAWSVSTTSIGLGTEVTEIRIERADPDGGDLDIDSISLTCPDGSLELQECSPSQRRSGGGACGLGAELALLAPLVRGLRRTRRSVEGTRA